MTRRSQFHQSNLVEHFQPLSPAFSDFTQQLSQGTHGTTADVTAQTYQIAVQQASLLSYLDALKAIAVIFLALLPLLLLSKPGAADVNAHVGE